MYIRYDDHDMTEVEVFTLKDEWLMTAKLVTALPALGATKEQIAAANSARKRELEIAKEMGHIGMAINPLSPLDQLHIRSERIAQEIANPERPKVMEIVNIPQVMRKAVGQMEEHSMKIPERLLRKPEPIEPKVDIMKILSKRKGD